MCGLGSVLDRRAFLRLGALGMGGLTLGGRFAPSASGGAAGGPVRSVVVVWLWGGPSHLDTFDPKPDAPVGYRGPFAPIETSVPGVRVCELLPLLARRAEKFALIRSMHHESNDHGVAGTIALTGNISGAVGLDGKTLGTAALRPSTGAIVGRLRPNRAGGLPPYLVLGDELHQGLKRVVGEGGGTLGTLSDPFRINYEPGVGLRMPDVALPENVPAARLGARWRLLADLDRAAGAGSAPAPAGMGRFYELAHALIASPETLSALDVDREPAPVRDRYGRHRVGQCCLIARRLVEAGLPFIQVNWSTHVEGPEDAGDGGWDMHDRYFQVMQDRHGWMLDQSLSALLDDLDARGLLGTTLVLALGEFGRTPKINDKAGRDHWNLCYSALVAGGGVQGGRVVGASDRRGEHPTRSPVTPADLNATALARLGISTTDLTALGLAPLGRPIDELF